VLVVGDERFDLSIDKIYICKEEVGDKYIVVGWNQLTHLHTSYIYILKDIGPSFVSNIIVIL
jgi:hypothetical protein